MTASGIAHAPLPAEAPWKATVESHCGEPLSGITALLSPVASLSSPSNAYAVQNALKVVARCAPDKGRLRRARSTPWAQPRCRTARSSVSISFAAGSHRCQPINRHRKAATGGALEFANLRTCPQAGSTNRPASAVRRKFLHKASLGIKFLIYFLGFVYVGYFSTILHRISKGACDANRPHQSRRQPAKR